MSAHVELWLKIISKIQTSVNNWKWGDKTWLQCFVIFLVVLFYPVYKLVDILEWLYWLIYYFGHIIQYIWTKYFLYNKQLIFIDNIFQWAHNSQVFRFSKFKYQHKSAFIIGIIKGNGGPVIPHSSPPSAGPWTGQLGMRYHHGRPKPVFIYIHSWDFVNTKIAAQDIQLSIKWYMTLTYM